MTKRGCYLAARGVVAPAFLFRRASADVSVALRLTPSHAAGARTRIAREYALGQRISEPKLTPSYRRRIVSASSARGVQGQRETYAHYSNPKAHGPIRSHPRRRRDQGIVSPRGHFGGGSALVDHSSET